MDNDLMARRLRPPSQPPRPSNRSAAQPPSPWDVPLADDGAFAPAEPAQPQQDPPFAPPDPQARADVPWDRPAAEAWPPPDDPGSDYQQPWSANADQPALPPAQPAWPTQPASPPQPAWPTQPASPPQPAWPADPLGDAAPWDRPANEQEHQSLDPDDAMAPVVADVNTSAGVWHEWSGGVADGYAAANGNGTGYATNGVSGEDGAHYAAAGTSEPMTVTAHDDQPHAADEPWAGDEPRAADETHAAYEPHAADETHAAYEPRAADEPHAADEPRPDAWADSFDMPAASAAAATSAGSGPSLPEWPAEDDLAPPAASHDPEMPDDSWTVAETQAHAEPEPEAERQPTEETPEVAAEQAAEVPPAPAQPVALPPMTPVIASAQIMPSPAGSPQNMVLRIELAIVDESQRANPADAAKRVGPDADVRIPDYSPRTHGSWEQMPEPEYLWAVPPMDVPEPSRRPGQSQQAAPGPRQVAPPPSAWPPAPAQPTQLDWELPHVGGPQVGGPQSEQLDPWSAPPQRQPQLPPAAPPPTWALTEPTPPYTPEPPQYTPPSAPRYQQPARYQPAQQSAWPPSQSPDPLYGLPATPNQQLAGYPPTGYEPAPYAPAMPVQSQYPAPSVQSAPAAGSRARTGRANAAADQADLWFLSNQPVVTSAPDDAQPTGKSSSLLTAGLTVGFALLVIVLVLVFIQVMTSLLR